MSLQVASTYPVPAFPNEIFALIAALATRKQPLAAMCLASRTLRALTEEFLYESVVLVDHDDVHAQRAIVCLDTIKAKPHLRHHIKRFTVELCKFEVCLRFVLLLPSLSILHLQVILPNFNPLACASMSMGLANVPQSVQYLHWPYRWCEEPAFFRIGLVRLPQLRALTVDIPHSDYPLGASPVDLMPSTTCPLLDAVCVDEILGFKILYTNGRNVRYARLSSARLRGPNDLLHFEAPLLGLHYLEISYLIEPCITVDTFINLPNLRFLFFWEDNWTWDIVETPVPIVPVNSLTKLVIGIVGRDNPYNEYWLNNSGDEYLHNLMNQDRDILSLTRKQRRDEYALSYSHMFFRENPTWTVVELVYRTSSWRNPSDMLDKRTYVRRDPNDEPGLSAPGDEWETIAPDYYWTRRSDLVD